MTSPTSRIEKRVWIKASPEVVFKALTDARDLAHWFCDRASCDPCEGGELIACWKTGKSSRKGRAVFTRIVPGSLLELLWIDEGLESDNENARHTLSYKIQYKTGNTEVMMLDEDTSVYDEESFAILDRGWNSVLLELKDYCEHKERSVKSHPKAEKPEKKSTSS
jgi:uncharacterized protein YndB with AHSA1/START domain